MNPTVEGSNLFMVRHQVGNSSSLTEKYEKAERGVIMHEQNCSELEAVHIIAERIAQNCSR